MYRQLVSIVSLVRRESIAVLKELACHHTQNEPAHIQRIGGETVTHFGRVCGPSTFPSTDSCRDGLQAPVTLDIETTGRCICAMKIQRPTLYMHVTSGPARAKTSSVDHARVPLVLQELGEADDQDDSAHLNQASVRPTTGDMLIGNELTPAMLSNRTRTLLPTFGVRTLPFESQVGMSSSEINLLTQ
jgi:hypothetical protein